MIRIKRAYEPPLWGDGRRILVERLWPRGVRKHDLAADAWLKDVAPSMELRKWFDHREGRWSEFRRRYRHELDANPEGWKPILAAGWRGTVTLLYAAHDTRHNGAVVLREYLVRRGSRPSLLRMRATPRLARGASGARKRPVLQSTTRQR
jgi:uncharacterized protein YeaO (DUF488 family)